MKIYIETYGCSANQAETEIISGLLRDSGFSLVDSLDHSDFVIINTCFVKTPTEQKILDRIKRILKRFPEKKLVIAGCMPEVIDRKLTSVAPRASLVSTHNTLKIVEAVRKTSAGERVIFRGKTKEIKTGKPRVRANEHVGITEISQGCNGNCAYCCVRLAKGPLHCYSPGDIVEDVRNALSEGCKEIWITSQDNAAYDHDGIMLPRLLKRICSVEGSFMVRVGMMNPAESMKIADGLIDVYKNEKVYKFLHMPIQSGSDRILRRMKRRYKIDEAVNLIENFRKAIPTITISTDVIVGFPGETDEDFEKSVSFIKETKPDVVNISKFGPRPGTEAAKMVQTDNRIIKKRSAIISEVVRKIALERNKNWVGWEGDIVVTEKGTGENQYIGRNFAYKPVLVESQENILGKTVKAEIKRAHATFLESS